MTYIVSSGEISSGIILENDTMTVLDGGIVTNTTFNSSYLIVSSGGTANDVTLNQGQFIVGSGGSASNVVLNSALVSMIPLRSFVSSGGSAYNITVNDDGRLVVEDGFADGVTVNSGGEFEIWGSGSATNVVWTPCNGAQIEIEADAYITFASAVSGIYYGESGELLSHADVMESKTVSLGGEMVIMSGGTAKSTIVCSGDLSVWSGTASDTTVSAAYLDVYPGGKVVNTTLLSDATLYLRTSNGTADNTIVHSGGWLRDYGVATRNTVGSGGRMDVGFYGIASDTTVSSGGSMSVYSGGKLMGKMTFESGAIVSAEEGTTFDFDLTQTEAGVAALVNDLSIVQGTPVYTLTVSEEQTGGIYALADGAAGFNGTISVVNRAGDALGTLTVGGETVFVGGTGYTLNLNESALSVMVESDDVKAPVITLSADTETVVLQTTLTATVDDGSTIQYRIGEFGLWKEYKEPIIASLNETYYFMAMNDAGNIGTNQITFGNIDTSGVLLSTLWSQRGINPMGGNTTIMYNEYTPLDPSVTPEAHCLTGCVNTAAGQLIYYFIEKGWLDLPLTLEEKDEYTSKHKATTEGGDAIVIPVKSDGSTPGTLSFAEINAMLSDFQLDSAEHAAALLYAIGVVLESKYSASSTGTSWNRVFFKRAGFEGETMGGPYFGEYYWGDMDDEMQYTITDAGFEVLIENLEAGLPVGATYPGHAFVIDGYDRESDTFHINLGWGGNQATRWYTRDEMQEELNCEYFVYDLNPEYVETFTVTDARVYGTGTMIRAFEQAAGMIGDNTVAFDPSVAGKTVELLNHITFFDEVISVKDFNMNVLVTESQGGENSYGFYADHIDVFESSDPVTVLTFHASGGSLIVSTEEEFNYAFQMEEALSCTVDADGMLIYGGKTSEGTDAAAVLQALQTCRSENTEVPDDLPDPNGWSFSGSSGNDVFSLSDSSIAVGNVSLGDGDDVLTLAGHSRLYGTIDAGDGDDAITVDSTSSISGDLSGKSRLNFVLAEREDHALFIIRTSVSGLSSDAALSVDMTHAEIGTYTLFTAAPGAADVTELRNFAITVTGSGDPDFTLSVNGTAANDYADLICEDNSLKLRVKAESGSIPPNVISVTPDITGPTRENVTLTATADLHTSYIQYTFDGSNWQTYRDSGVVVTENRVVFFRAVSATPLYSDLVSYAVTNIDRAAPVAPIASADVTAVTNGDVLVSAEFSADSEVREYSLDGQSWNAYDGSVKFAENGTVSFRGTDAAGNVSEAVSYTVSNIDKAAPAAPSGLRAIVSDRTVSLVWDVSADDLAGTKEYIVKYSHDGQEFTATTGGTHFLIENADCATWQWSVQAVDNAGNISGPTDGDAFIVTPGPDPAPRNFAGSDVDGNGVSDVLFQWTGGDNQTGFWMNGHAQWRSQSRGHSSEWTILGTRDMNADGKADTVMFGQVSIIDMQGTYIGYYSEGIDTDANWHTIGFLLDQGPASSAAWENAVGNLTGNANANSIVWYSPDLYVVGVWADGTDDWTALSYDFGGDDWTLIGCGDFDGDGRDSVVMSGAGGTYFYAVGIDGLPVSMGSANWSGWEVRAIGDFAGDGRDDMVLFHKESGSMVMLADGNLDDYTSIGQLDAQDWFVVGAGDYNGDQKDDLLVRQYTTGMLGYYKSGDTSQWVELGRGVDMNWTVIA